MGAKTRAEILPSLTPVTVASQDLILDKQLLNPARPYYMGRTVPPEYFTVQDWCVAQGLSSTSDIPDLTSVLQGVEYLIAAATDEDPTARSLEELQVISPYLHRNELFEGGVLIQFPDLAPVLLQALSSLPFGDDTIKVLRQISEYEILR